MKSPLSTERAKKKPVAGRRGPFPFRVGTGCLPARLRRGWGNGASCAEERDSRPRAPPCITGSTASRRGWLGPAPPQPTPLRDSSQSHLWNHHLSSLEHQQKLPRKHHQWLSFWVKTRCQTYRSSFRSPMVCQFI